MDSRCGESVSAATVISTGLPQWGQATLALRSAICCRNVSNASPQCGQTIVLVLVHIACPLLRERSSPICCIFLASHRPATFARSGASLAAGCRLGCANRTRPTRIGNGIDRRSAIWRNRMCNVGSLVKPLLDAVRTLNLIRNGRNVQQILAKRFRLVTAEQNKALTVNTRNAVIDGYHGGRIITLAGMPITSGKT